MSVKVRNGGAIRVDVPDPDEDGAARLRRVGPLSVSTPDPAEQSEVRLVGTPGPQGPEGPRGPNGTLDEGVVLDGGNF